MNIKQLEQDLRRMARDAMQAGDNISKEIWDQVHLERRDMTGSPESEEAELMYATSKRLYLAADKIAVFMGKVGL